MKRNKFSKALKHLKSKKRLDETAPTNSMSGVYQVSPSTGDAFRLGPKDPPKRFYPKADGTWPAGIPGDPNKIHYDRPAGYWGSGRNTQPEVGTPTERDYSYGDVTAKGTTDTTTLIRASDGKVYTSLPPNSESFILGPVVTSYAINHGDDDYTNLGYIQKDTRQFVLLARIQGFFKGEDKPRTSYGGGFGRTWDGDASGLQIFNSNFTLDHALWMRETYLNGNFKANFPFNFAGGIPVERHPENSGMGGGDILGTDDGKESKDGDSSGTEQDDPDDTDLEKLDLWGLIKKGAREFGDRFDKAVEDGIAELVDALGDKFNEVMDGVIENLGKITGMESAANMLNRYDDFLKNNPNGSDERIDVTNEFSARDLNTLNDVRNDPTVNDAINKAIEINNDPERANKVTNTGETVGDLLWEIAADKVRDKLQDAVYSTGGLDNSIHNNVQIDFDEFKNSGGEDWTIVKNYEFRPGGSVEGAEDTPLGSALTSAGVELDSLGAGSIPVVVGAVIAAKTGITGANQHGGLYNSPTMKYKVKVPKTKIKPDQGGQGGRPLGSTTDRGGVIESRTFDKKRILREVKRPVLIEATPKTTKLKGYKPNFKGKFSPQNTPDVTASKKSDEAVHGYNTSRMAWTSKDKFWKQYETTERMNVIYDRVGFGQQYFDEISGENLRTKAKKKREVQEHLNQLAHQKAMREVYGVTEFKNKIDEAETYDNKVKDPLFAKVANRLKKEIDYSDKPSPHGYPTEPPAKIDPKTGMHPKYGKRYKYDKLDPVSAVMMKRAPTGDPEIDANVKKAAQERKEHLEIDDKISEWMFGKLKRDWRKELDEGMTTANAISTILPAEGDVAIDQVTPTDAASFADVNNMFGAGADNPALDGTTIRANGSGSGSEGGFNVGGQYLAFQGTGSGGSRMALLKPMDATKVDTLTITAIRGNGVNGGEEADIVGQEELFVIYKTPDMTRSSYLSQDRTQTNIGSFPADAAIIAIGQGNGTLQNYSITIPEYARQKDVVFGLFQLSHSGSGYDHYGVTDIKFQRRTPLNVVVPLDSPEAVSFIRVGVNEGDPKKRKKRVDDMLKASDEYTAKQMGGEFPGQGNRIDTRDPFAPSPLTDPDASPIGKDAVTKSFKDFSAQTEPAEQEPEPTPSEEPSNQVTLQPKDENGNEIEVKDIGAGAIQGADAAKLEAETEAEPEAEVEPEVKPIGSGSVDEPEMEPSEEEMKPSEEEKEGKNEDEIKELEKNKFMQQYDKVVKNVADHIIYQTDKLLDLPVDKFVDYSVVFLKTLRTIAQGFTTLSKLGGLIGGLPDEANEMMKYFETRQLQWDKYINDANIFRTILTGEIKTQDYSPFQIGKLKENLNPLMFMGKDFYKENGGNFGISDTRHEYADDNIYVLNGKVYNNKDLPPSQRATSLANMGVFTPEIDGIGRGYGQMIIPKDGSEPYFHFYDYNYYNMNSTDTVGGKVVGGEIPSKFQKFMADLAGLTRRVLPGRLFNDLINKFEGNLNTFNNNLKKRVGLDGWPPGIHGATLHDFKIPVSELSQEMQDMINAHPLSWSDERIANMSYDEITQQLKGVTDDYANEYYDKYMKYIRDPKQVPPEFAEAIKKVDGLFDEYTEVDAKIREIKDNLNVGKGRNAYMYIKNNKAAEAGQKEYDRVLKILQDYYKDQKAQGYENYDAKYVTKMGNQLESIMRSYLKSAGAKFESGGYGGAIVTDPNATYDDFVYPNGRVVKGLGGELRDAQAELDEIDELMLSAMDGFDDDFFKSIDGKFIQIAKREIFTKDGKYSQISPESWTPGRKGTGNVPGGYRSSGATSTPRSGYAGLSADDASFVSVTSNRRKNNKNNESYLLAVDKYKSIMDHKNFIESKFFNPKDIKPTFPPNDPPEIDKETGMHANYGKQAGRYKKLDPMSANAMPATGDPEIDAVVNKQRTGKTPEQKKKDYIKTASRIKKLAKKR